MHTNGTLAGTPQTNENGDAPANESAPVRPATVPSPTSGVDMERLIGKPHLFGRVKQLRQGILIEPFGTLTLQPNGHVTGYGHPNEKTWIPYIHGTVSGDKAFAFITAKNTWIPSSTWTQSMGDIPTGHFCDEPETTGSAQQLCLIPATPLPRDTTTVYLIATCKRFYEQTMGSILSQLYAEGVKPNQIKVVVNGCSENSGTVLNGVDYAFSTHDAWEWSALYEAPLRWKFDYAFLIHDTSVIFPGFRRSVEEVNGHIAWDHLPASPMARCLLGLYSHNFLMRCNDWLKSIDHIDKKNGVIAEAAGELLLRARSALVIGDPELSGGFRAAEWKETLDFFNTGSPRVRRVFPSVKVHKFIHVGPTDAKSL